MAGTLAEVTDNNFQAEVIESETPVLVDFWAPWCGPCRVVAPVLEEIAAEREDLRVVKLNIDDNQQTAAAFEVLSIPTMILFRAASRSRRSSAPTRRRSSRRSSSTRAGARRSRPAAQRRRARSRIFSSRPSIATLGSSQRARARRRRRDVASVSPAM